ncbi:MULTISPECIES: tRNA uridine-5-carboxymethylaminomethyl(34) synthesis GTPase MnmE [Anaerococcus]|uniref:tRNA modification GTPase MnmE n=1 Tax=Anaerococcus octavius TaxID=54007 RepID=A0A380WYN8_9FIRM|nr:MULTISPECIES: tRNA uridine-5-carboxymethylaminomethyl(34) synthesis GTPase MnmE [Anaerococcus]MBS6105204.1 tRNA uridine-5-carboxymethylaminomethyl(34) synthesis GTPase MnmE [Anaerococcus sp.]MDU3176734.1 tRNA uridine-5-carboxymethylaminomethyl(34) synthesis GTPase MnmE [Anaerococcus sp.]MDU4025818.1 tRNA uridine-5-carboxymethylaminomethyl(34) synthesis GTPase MnmE [Anaerococcus sp.]SUU93244.1 tRNA modification GTPase MnmE [Anaerococcus octavius]
MSEATIAAISTPTGTGGISIVRMSGDKSKEIIDQIFEPINGGSIDRKKDNRRMRYGNIVDNDEIIDEVMVNFMAGPGTYTREDIAEINCHGSFISVKKILNLLLDKGAVLAEPGEFTKRAFLNGRIDLSQAEAVLDIINSTNDLSQAQGINQLNGSLRNEIEKIRQSLLEALSRLEYSINFTEDGEDLSPDEIIAYMDEAKNRIDKLLNTSNKGKIIREGINTTILGKPNVGKSSLLNALLKENRAIVTDIPGTTRDLISEYINLGSFTLKINDTAGIRDTDDIVEKIGVDKSIEISKASDLIMALFDTSRKFDKEDQKILDLIEGKNSIIILNKTDLDQQFDRTIFDGVDLPIIETSMTENIGIDKLEETITEIFDTSEINRESILITNTRHERLLNEANKKLNESLADIKRGIPLDAVEVDLRGSYDDLGLIIGESVSDEIMDKVFKEFCVGK